MRMQKGICMELDGDRSVYMLADGNFVTGRPTEGTLVGEEAYFETVDNTLKKRRFKPVALPLIASVAALFLLISTWMLPAEEAYGYVQVESNPAIELGVDDEWNVISLRELNDDGKQLIAKLADWENKELEVVLENVLALSVDEDTEHVTITTVQGDEETEATNNVEKIALAALFAGSNKNLRVHLKEANKKQWREAKEQQVPVAKLIEKDRTFTSPHEQESDVQPAQNKDAQEKQAPNSRKAPSKAEDPAISEAQPKNEPSSSGNNKAEKTQKPDTQAKPVPEKKTNDKPKEPASKAPAAQKQPKKPEKPEPAKPKNPNAGKDNNSGNSKTKPKPKKENPYSGNNKAKQPPKDNKGKGSPVDNKPEKKNSKNGNFNSNSNNSGNSSKANGAKKAEPKDLKAEQSKPPVKKKDASDSPKASEKQNPKAGKQVGQDKQDKKNQ